MIYFNKKGWDMLTEQQQKEFKEGVSSIYDGILQLKHMGVPISKIVEILEGELSEAFSKEDVMNELLKDKKQ